MEQSVYNTYLNACKKGDLDTIKNLFSDDQFKKSFSSTIFSGGFNTACGVGQLEVVKLLEQSYLGNPLNAVFDKPSGFRRACASGHQNVADYLFSNELSHETLRQTFKDVCENGHAHIISYLVEKTNLKDELQEGLFIACGQDHLEAVKTLYDLCKQEKFELTQYSQDLLFAQSCTKENKIMNYFLYDLKIELSNSIKKELKKFYTIETQKIIENHFQKRDLFFSLNKNCENDENHTMKLQKI